MTKKLFLLLILLTVSIFLGIIIGSVNASIFDLIKFLSGKNDVLGYIVFEVRMPRTFAAAIAGASLAVSGLLLQTYFRNPLAGPYVLGISSAASFGVALYILAGVILVPNFSFYAPAFVVSALLGSAIAILVLVLVAAKVRSGVTLLIVGLMIGYAFSAVDQILITFANARNVQIYILWSFGTFSGVTWSYLEFMLIILLPVIVSSFFLSKSLNALLLGEEYAKTMGINVKVVRIAIMCISAILTAVVTAYCGIIAFVGLAVPHIVRLFFKTSNHFILIPASALAGASITVLCDIIARMLLNPIELPISVVTSLFGAPIVIYLVINR